MNTLGGGDYRKLCLGFSVQGLLCWRIESGLVGVVLAVSKALLLIVSTPHS